jgi:hypothetical protein
MEERITNALKNARLAFWAEVAKSFPETDTGRSCGSGHRSGDGRRARAYPVRLFTSRVGD